MPPTTDYTKLFVVDLLSFRLHCKIFEEGFAYARLSLIYHTQQVTAKKVNIIGAIQRIKGNTLIQMNSHFKMVNAKMKLKVFVTNKSNEKSV